MPMPPTPDSRIRRSRRGPALAAVLAATALAAAPSASADPAASDARGAAARPTVVLVHGAFADGSSWAGVVQRLQRDGYRVIAPANPLRGLPGDSAYIASVLRSIPGPIVLVGHSYGGAVISNAAFGNAHVKALVYIAALVPDQGETLSVLSARFPGSALNAALKSVPFTKPDGTTGTDLYIKPDRFRAVFAASLPPVSTAVLAATQRPINAAAFADKAGPAAWKTIPSWALVATRDRAIAPALERFEAGRAHSHTIEVDSPHLAMVAHPEAVTTLILDAARSQAPAAAPAGTKADTLADTGATNRIVAGAACAAVLAGATLLGVARRRRPTGPPADR
ncbi:alpha/beta fold hydrolase [Streptomyces sp. NPDC092296]|uniref:alpha/beta fold hydrolase n=1 Tax=Streptomyces sp. NPDC092296 TaxID=3366012 RepID=UPI00381EBD75